MRTRARVKINGSVACRQRPGKATPVVRPSLFERARLVIDLEPALVITERLQNEQGAIHVISEEIVGLRGFGLPGQASHNYH